MKYTQIIGLLVMMMFLAGCGLYQGEDDLTGGAVVDEITEAVEEVVEEVEEAVEEVIPEHDAEVKELMEKSADIDNYQYGYSSSVLKSNGVYHAEPTYDVYIKGDKIKKSYLSPIKIGGAHYSDIYLIDGKAFGACTSRAVLCEDSGMAMSLSYSTHKLKLTPWDLIQDVPADAEIVGTETFDNRKVKIVQYGEGDNKVKLSVDPYYGLPLKKVVYGYDDDEEIKLEQYNFKELAVNRVVNADVSLD